MTFNFDDFVAESHHFGHREHLHATWLAVSAHGTAAAVDLISAGIRRTARYAGAPQKYHATMSRAWVELVAFHTAPDFATLLADNPALLDKRLLLRFYSPAVLSSPAARAGWVEPDLHPLPTRQGRLGK